MLLVLLGLGQLLLLGHAAALELLQDRLLDHVLRPGVLVHLQGVLLLLPAVRQHPHAHHHQPFVQLAFQVGGQLVRALDLGRVDVRGPALLAARVPLVHRLLAHPEDVPPEVDHLRVLHVVKLVHAASDGQSDFGVELLLFCVSLRLNYLQQRVEEVEIAEPPRLVVELFLLRVTCDGHKNVGRGIPKPVEQRVLLGNVPKVIFDAFQRSIPGTVQGYDDSRGHETVHDYGVGHEREAP
uniref:Putative secreted protein n=1 Tax=Ixodes ricinus TaxID=34613 RepID=A0A6B0V5A5_IXORI